MAAPRITKNLSAASAVLPFFAGGLFGLFQNGNVGAFPVWRFAINGGADIFAAGIFALVGERLLACFSVSNCDDVRRSAGVNADAK